MTIFIIVPKHNLDSLKSTSEFVAAEKLCQMPYSQYIGFQMRHPVLKEVLAASPSILRATHINYCVQTQCLESVDTCYG
jgi:hypothetical protein